MKAAVLSSLAIFMLVTLIHAELKEAVYIGTVALILWFLFYGT